MNNKFKTDVLIIGAGPVGIFASFQAGLLGMKSVIIDALTEVGGQLTALYPLKPIYDIPGFPSIVAQDLIENLVEQAKPYDPTYLLNQKAMKLEKREDGSFVVETSLNNVIEAKSIVIAGGAGAFGPNRLPIPGLKDLENDSVFYSIKDPNIFKGKTVTIAGGGDSAVDWALSLSENIASKVYLVHRRDNFRAMPSSLEKLKALAQGDTLELLTPYRPKDIKCNVHNCLECVVLESMDGSIKEVKTDFLLPFFGLARDLGGLTDWGLEIDKINGTIVADPITYETNVNGIYVVGDMAKYNHKLKLIMVGFSEVAYAIHDSWKYVFPDKVFRFVHSTSKN